MENEPFNFEIRTDSPAVGTSHAWIGRLGWSTSLALHLAFMCGTVFVVFRTSLPRPEIILATVEVAARTGHASEPMSECLVHHHQDVPVSAARGVSDLIERAIVHSRRIDPQRRLRKLEHLAERLHRLSNHQHVTSITAAIQPLLRGFKSTSKPAWAAVDSEFDYVTAQLVAADYDPQSGQYLGILEDCTGRRKSVELDPTTGPEIVQVMQLIKRFPLLDLIYRNIVTQLLSQLLLEQSGPTGWETLPQDETQQLTTSRV